ncbi:NAD(P)-dependent oxidoreductase [Streptomyces sp. TS71-3]|uniref:NAD(P)-dependent oxidoreductase n=1 Tax=Streptomyces sp. TS71-3 TaxID=2733862 RepID=UPI001BB40933|nr:NAD(P)-dependent oxidoreductase [Streptomyces sp. TS71-3]
MTGLPGTAQGPSGAPEIGLIGLGPMGTALAVGLLRAGWPVRCHDARPEAVAEAVAAGATTAGSPRELATRCRWVLTFLPGPDQVHEAALDPERGVLAGLAPGGLLLDLSTCGPDTAELLGARFAAAGRRFLDCPVSRKAPDSTLLVGGAEGVLGELEPALRAVSRTLVHCGRLGAGYTVKLLNQHIKYAWYLASAEALLIAEAVGLDPALAAEAVQECSGAESGLSTAASYFRGDTAAVRTRAPATTIAKDMALAERLAESAAIHSPTLDVTAAFFRHVMDTPYRHRPYPESSALLPSYTAPPASDTPSPPPPADAPATPAG